MTIDPRLRARAATVLRALADQVAPPAPEPPACSVRVDRDHLRKLQNDSLWSLRQTLTEVMTHDPFAGMAWLTDDQVRLMQLLAELEQTLRDADAHDLSVGRWPVKSR